MGIGLNYHLFDGDGIISVKVGDDPTIYDLDKMEARNFIRKYKSTDKVEKTGTLLWVIPFGMFTPRKECPTQPRQ